MSEKLKSPVYELLENMLSRGNYDEAITLIQEGNKASDDLMEEIRILLKANNETLIAIKFLMPCANEEPEYASAISKLVDTYGDLLEKIDSQTDSLKELCNAMKIAQKVFVESLKNPEKDIRRSVNWVKLKAFFNVE